jgi:hypothetical protein
MPTRPAIAAYPQDRAGDRRGKQAFFLSGSSVTVGLRVVDSVDGEVDGVRCIQLGPVRDPGRSFGVPLICPLVDLCLDVLSSGSSIGLHLRPLALGLARRSPQLAAWHLDTGEINILQRGAV